MWLVALLLLNYQDVHSSYFREQNPIKLSSYKEKKLSKLFSNHGLPHKAEGREWAQINVLPGHNLCLC